MELKLSQPILLSAPAATECTLRLLSYCPPLQLLSKSQLTSLVSPVSQQSAILIQVKHLFRIWSPESERFVSLMPIKVVPITNIT